MPDNIIKFGKAKKALAKSAKEANAAQNRVKFGRTKAQKRLDKMRADKNARHIDGHQRNDPSDSPEN